MIKIINVKGRQVFDSRGNPTVEAEIFFDNKISASAIAPSGASTGAYEAYELRDNNPKAFLGKSVLKAVDNINSKISKALSAKNLLSQKNLDQIMLELDGTKNKKNLGANAILAVSLAYAKATAKSNNQPLYKSLGNSFSLVGESDSQLLLSKNF